MSKAYCSLIIELISVYSVAGKYFPFKLDDDLYIKCTALSRPASIISTTAHYVHTVLSTPVAHLKTMARTKNTARKSTGKHFKDLGRMHPRTPTYLALILGGKPAAPHKGSSQSWTDSEALKRWSPTAPHKVLPLPSLPDDEQKAPREGSFLPFQLSCTFTESFTERHTTQDRGKNNEAGCYFAEKNVCAAFARVQSLYAR